ncbi:MAG: sulfotransferase [Nitrosomonadales bacterium]|nr:sulfotransferase [Nitrosomonadales bacterium]
MIGAQLLKQVKDQTFSAYAQLSYKRKCRLYCVGAAKTGTHSIDTMFDDTVKSQHEADDDEVIQKILEISSGDISQSELLTYIRQRDKRLCLDVDSSQLNFFLLDQLLHEFPDARFLLTIRDCYSWLNSFIDDSLRRQPSENWIKLREHRFRSDLFSHPPEEKVLKEEDLYTLDGYLSYWTDHNNKVLDTVPADRLLIVKTTDISKRAHEIADFAGLPRETVQVQHTHAFKNPEKFNVLRDIPQAYLETKVRQHCTPLMTRFFPEIKSMQDAGI